MPNQRELEFRQKESAKNPEEDNRHPSSELFPGSRPIANWEKALTHRLRVLLHTGPLHDLRRGDSYRGEDLRHYDSLTLVIKVFDLIVDTMGLDREVNRARVAQALSPLLYAMDASAGIVPDRERHAAMVDRVIAGLRNDAEQRRPFELTYGDFDEQGMAVRRRLEFRLVSDQFHPEGGTVLRLSNEAINLYLNAFDLDIEDAQAAAEAVVQSQLARGRFEEAVQSARGARLQSLRYKEKIGGILRETRRNLAGMDWREEVPKFLEEALTHIEIRLATEGGILAAAEERLSLLAEEESSAQAVAQVVRLIRDCRLRHTDLHHQLMPARIIFLDEQARQSFAPKSALHLPELFSEVLEPILRLGRADASKVLSHGFPCFFGARPVAATSLCDLVTWQLQPRKEHVQPEVAVSGQDLSDYDVDILHFPAHVRERAEEVLAGAGPRTTLSDLLSVARNDRCAREVLEALILMVLHQFDPEDIENPPLRVETVPGRMLETEGFAGDELEVFFAEAEKDDGT